MINCGPREDVSVYGAKRPAPRSCWWRCDRQGSSSLEASSVHTGRLHGRHPVVVPRVNHQLGCNTGPSAASLLGMTDARSSSRTGQSLASNLQEEVGRQTL